MFFKTQTNKSTRNFSAEIDRLREALAQADAVIVGAGAGLSTSAGFTYTGERFRQFFSDFAERYGIRDMYSGGFCPFSTQKEFWAYWSRYIWINRYLDPPKPFYQDLLKLVEEKNYFVLTTNVDHCFQKTGFAKDRLFYTQGDYGLFQCSEPCCQETFDNESAVKAMLEQQRDMQIPSELLPHCPHCGKPMTMNLRSDDKFVQDQGWYQAASRYEDFQRRHRSQRVLLLELGVGYNTPGIIKFPFWRQTAENSKAVYACLNFGEAACPPEIEKQSICISDDIGMVITALLA